MGVALAIAGQSGVWSLGYNTTALEDRPQPGDLAYAWLHGGLILSALAVMALLGGTLWRETVRTLGQGRITVEALFSLSLVGAFAGSVIATVTGATGVYYEVVPIVLVIYMLGKYATARNQAAAMAEVGRMRAQFGRARVCTGDGASAWREVDSVAMGEEVEVLPREPITVDGTILRGQGYVVETALTGELGPVTRGPGDRVFAGSEALDGAFRIRVEKGGGRRRLDSILRGLSAAGLQGTDLQRQADRVVRVFVPLVALVACGTLAYWYFDPSTPGWQALFHAMCVLLVACPCAFGLATPIAIWSGVVGLARLGLVASSGNLLDRLAGVDLAVFDKTGTLTEPRLAIKEWRFDPGFGGRAEELRTLVAVAERGVNHPIADMLAEVGLDASAGSGLVVEERRVVPGQGVWARLRTRSGAHTVVTVGTPALLAQGLPESPPGAGSVSSRQFAPPLPESGPDRAGSRLRSVEVGLNGSRAASLVFEERLRPQTEAMLRDLGHLGLRTAVLTGDPQPGWRSIGPAAVEFGVGPQEKRDWVLRERRMGNRVLFVGDGSNDAPALAAADAGIALHGGAPLSRAAALGTLPGDNPAVLPSAIRLARRVRCAVEANMKYALVYNSVGMAVAACGWLHPITAALLMAVSSFWVSVRALRSARLDAPLGFPEKVLPSSSPTRP